MEALFWQRQKDIIKAQFLINGMPFIRIATQRMAFWLSPEGRAFKHPSSLLYSLIKGITIFCGICLEYRHLKIRRIMLPLVKVPS